MSAPSVIASNLYRVEGKGWLLGRVDLYVPGWRLHFRRCLWGRDQKGREAVLFPKQKYTRKDGSEGDHAIVEWGERATAERWRAAALEAIHRLVAGQGKNDGHAQ